jgi:hypothetical protein
MARMSNSSDSDGGNGRHWSSRSSKARTYECKICGNEFNSGQSLGGHMNVHRRDPRSSSRSPTPQSGEYNCASSSDSSYKGVRYRSEQNKWVAEIRPPKSSKTWWLGTYSTAIEAAYAYDVAITYFGSETSLNFDGHPVYDQIPRISPNLPKQDFAVQLRKVVKEFGKLAMQSDHPRGETEAEEEEEEEEEEEASSSSCGAHDQSPAYEHQQHIGFEEIDWDAAFPDQPTLPDQSFNTIYDAPFDFEMPPATHENYHYGAYQPPSDYHPPTYYVQSPPATSSGYFHEPSHGYNYNAYNQPQQQLWDSPYH